MSKSKKELNAWDRFWLSVKANEKIIWVGLLVILAPTFAFPIASNVFTGPSHGGTQMVIFGEKISGADYQMAMLDLRMVSRIRRVPSPFVTIDYTNPGDFRLDVPRFLIYGREADRVGIRVSDQELGSEVRQLYWTLAAQEAGREAMLKALGKAEKGEKKDSRMEGQQAFWQASSARLKELEERGEFTEAQQEDWYSKLQEMKVDRRDFEAALREVMKAEKLEEYVKNSVQVKPEDAVEEFKKAEQSRKFSFFEVRADEAKAEAEKAVTPEEIKENYDKNREQFEEPLAIRVEYLYVPVAAFGEKAAVTDEDVRKEYDRVKVQKYQTFVGGPVEGNSDLLTPEEKAARDEKAFRPFEEVAEEVRTQVEKQKTIDEARQVTDKIRERIFPPKPGAIGEKKEEKPAPEGATYADIAKDFPMVKTGTTHWVAQKDAEKTLGPEVYSSQFVSWFSQANRNLQDKTAKKDIEAPKSYVALPSGVEPKEFIFYRNPQVRPAGVPKLDEIRDKVRDEVVKVKLLERAREKAKALSEAVREGKKTFEDAAKEAGQQVVTTTFLEQSGVIKTPLSEEEKKKAEAAAAENKSKSPFPVPDDDSPAPKEKDHPGSRAILDFGFKALHEKGKVDGFAEDPENAACYLVRWDDVIYPDLSQFEKKRQRYQGLVLHEKQTAYVAEWSKDLYKRADARSALHGSDEG